ncbi:MAG: HAMP domain-containing protein [Desulfobulbaceae bacterium]|nr:MAG: HAMP domain-containing protein [Desulfobulbaceae bacterium]
MSNHSDEQSGQEYLRPEKLHPLKPYITEEQRAQKKRLVGRITIFCICLIPFFTWLQGKLFSQNFDLPINANIIIFVLININVILLLIVLFLVLRYLAELLIERKLNILGSRLRTKLVISFLSLSLIPTILLFFVSLQFVSSSVDYWFNASIENSLQESLNLAQDFIQESRTQVKSTGNDVAERIITDPDWHYSAEYLQSFLKDMLRLSPSSSQTSLMLILEHNGLVFTESAPGLQAVLIPELPLDLLNRVKEGNSQEILMQETPQGDLVRYIRLTSNTTPVDNKNVLVTTMLIDKDKLDRMTRISKGIENYRQLIHLRGPFKFWLLIILLFVTLLIIFAAIWFGLRIARTITEPVDRLVGATRLISDGDFNFSMDDEVSNDEIGQLVTSFNSMKANIDSSNKKLAETHHMLEESSLEADRRRRYTEIILQNVSAGVISLDDHGRITTINRFAEKLLRIDRKRFISLTYREALPLEYTLILDRFMEELYVTGKTTIEQHLKVTINRTTLSLLINFTRLEDDDGKPIGFVLVFDNLTKIEKMQRMAAWREVARRIAHEIKNPLTPIQLSAQRLRRKYPEILAEDDSVFDRCTETIISQVDELKRLVSEFSQFARMPKINKAPGDLLALARETLVLYQEAHKDIDFSCTDTTVPEFEFDAEQIKRCIINLLDNAVGVLPDGGKISIDISSETESGRILLKVSDNGPGISKDNKTKLFEPYFSTKKSGTGLGLAIVSTIISDHGGYIRVEDNQPTGSIFIIDLPMQSQPAVPEHGPKVY